MPRLNKLFQLFQHGETGGPVLGVEWPFEPENREGYRVRAIAEAPRGTDSVNVSVFAGETDGRVENDVPDGAIGLSVAAGTRIAIRESYFELTDDVEWVQSSLDDAVDVVWDPSNVLGRGWNPEFPVETGDIFQRFEAATQRTEYTAELARVTANAAAYKTELVRSTGQDAEGVFDYPATLWTGERGFLGARYEGFASEAADVRYWIGDGDSYRSGFGAGLELRPNYDSLRFRLMYKTPVWEYSTRRDSVTQSVERVARQGASSSPYQRPGFNATESGLPPIHTNKPDSRGKRTGQLNRTIPTVLQDVNDVDLGRFANTYTDGFPWRTVRAVPDWVDPATLTVNTRTFVRLAGNSGTVRLGEHLAGIWFEVGDHAPFLEYIQRRSTQSVGLETYAGGYEWMIPGHSHELSDDAATDPEVAPWWQYQRVRDLLPNAAPDAAVQAKARYQEMRDATDEWEFVSRARLRELWNGIVRAVADYFTPPGDVAAASFSPRLHPIRSETSSFVGSLPRGANLAQSRAGAVNAVPAAAIRVFFDEPPIDEWDGFLSLTDMGFRGRIERLPADLEIRYGLEWDSGTQSYRWREDLFGDGALPQDLSTVLRFQNFVFPTVIDIPGGQDGLIDDGIRTNLTGDRYPLVLTAEIAGGSVSTIQRFDIAPILPFTVNPGEFVSIIERVIPTQDDTRTVWGATLERRSRNELVVGLDGTGNVEQTQTVDRAEFEVRNTGSIDAGMFLRDDGGRLWEIVGVADAPSRRNVILTCERVFDRRRRATTFPRFAVPIRRV